MHRLLIVFSLIVLTSCAPKSSSTRVNLKNSFIINGADVKIGDGIASSVVGVYNIKEKALCTGSLIASNIVLTAAHCSPEHVSDLKIIFTNDIDDIITSHEADILQEFMLSATDFKVGPTWDPKNESIEINTGDIALVKFKGKIPAGYRPATFLADASLLKIGNMVTVAGFGVNIVSSKKIDPNKYPHLDEAIEYGEVLCDDENGKNINCVEIDTDGDGILRTTTAPISSTQTTEIILDERKSGTCSGDSGGPAYIRQNGEFYLFGVTSRGSALCDEVGVYTNALYYRPWIAETIKLLK
ncbi:MAG: trypsin-like serine protease [Bacteriovorax sp.]|nr:trypsin-like serine protease [Bacteriovorax sp.]